MPNLSTMTAEGKPQHMIIYGPSFSGKTALAAQVAKKFKVLYLDGENGSSTLLELPEERKLTEKELSNIFVQQVYDNKDNPNFGKTSLLLASGGEYQVCDKHGIVMNAQAAGVIPCKECRQELANAMAQTAADKTPDSEPAIYFESIINTWELNKLDPSEWVVIFDSFTQICTSTNAHVTKNLNIEKDKEEYKHWMAQGKLLEKFLDYIQNARFNCIVVAHELGVKQVDGTDKIIPAGGTENFSRKVAKYFDASVYCQIKNKKHKIISTTTEDSRILAGSRGSLVIEDGESICKFFGK